MNGAHALAAFAVVAALLDAGQQSPRFRSGAEAVTVDALITSGGRPIAGLRAQDFELLDNGQPQQIALLSVDVVPLRFVLALDLSESVIGDRLSSLLQACRHVIEGMRPIDSAAILTFSHEILERSPLTGDRRRLFDAIGGLTAGGDTSLYDATCAGLQLAPRGDGRTLLLLFSDGIDASSWLEPAAVLDSAARSDVVVYAVSTGPAALTPPFLDRVTASTGGRLLHATDRGIPAKVTEILQEFQNRYLLMYVPSGVETKGWHEITLRVKGRRADVRARRGYTR